MRKLLLPSFLIITHLVAAQTWKCVNPIIGDQSYIVKYGELPNEVTSDHTRIATHLEYAEYVLRSKDLTGLCTKQIQKRTHLLDLLHEYWTRGIFPTNTDVSTERRPCFIDHNGTICAVGYLVEQTVGRDVAELINERFMYSEILEMNDPVVLNWIEECGLTQEECAIIQPSYNYNPPPATRLSYGVTYRIEDGFYQTIRFERQFKLNRYRRLNPGWGTQLEWFNQGSFSAGVLFSAQLNANRWRNIIRSFEIMPEYFQCGVYSGMNLRPGFQMTRAWGRFSLGGGYSYAIPVINETDYAIGRHDFTLRAGFNLTNLRLPKIPKKPKEDKPGDA